MSAERMERGSGRAAIRVGALAAVLLLASGGFGADDTQALDEARARLKASRALVDLRQVFRDVATVVEPSVVQIEVHGRLDAERPRGFQLPPDFEVPPGFDEDMFRRFFGPQWQPRRGQPRRQERDYREYDVPPTVGLGSGWVFDEQGHIVTNNHVIEKADKITVKFFDKSEVDAKVVGTDPHTDIAVLEVQAPNLRPAQLAEGPLEQGDIVFAFGSPLQFEFSMSQGIVSGQSRRTGILGQMGFESFIQTDAAINPGNSGGPLTDIYGQVVGMNTMIVSRTGLFSGVGFAIPVPMIKQVVEQLIATGKVSRGFLGVSIRDDAELLKSFGFEGKGVLVDDVRPDLPAAKAGVQRGDIITAVDGNPAASSEELRRMVAAKGPGATVRLGIFRDGKTLDLEVTLAEMPARLAAGAAEEEGAESGAGIAPDRFEPLRQLGLERATTLTAELAQELNMEFAPGVLVQEVRPGSVAAASGLEPGAVLVDVVDKPVRTVEELADAIGKHDLKRGVRVTVRVNDRNHYVNHYVLLKLPG